MGGLCPGSSEKNSGSTSTATNARKDPTSPPVGPAEQKPATSQAAVVEGENAPNARKNPSSSSPVGPAEKKPATSQAAAVEGENAPNARKDPSSSSPVGPAEKKPAISQAAAVEGENARNARKDSSSSPLVGPAEKKPPTFPAPAVEGKNAKDHSSSPPVGPAEKKPAISQAPPVEGENIDVDLDGLVQYISWLLERIQKKSSRPKPSTLPYWPTTSSGCMRLNEFLTHGIEAASAWKDIVPGNTNICRSLLNGIGEAHWAAAGLLVVSHILERYETIRANKNECLCLLEEMNNLAQHVKKLKGRPRLREGMEASIQNATELILEGSFMICTQIDSPKFSKFFLTYVNEDALLKFRQKLKRVAKRMENEMGICLYDATECRLERPLKPRERAYPEYAVGIEKPLEEVIPLLEWESGKNAKAVILHGLGGIGKTILADAVFARLYIEGCKYSMVRLDDMTSSPNIVELQKCILKDLNIKTDEVMTDKPDIGPMLENIRTFEDGQREIGRMLEKEVAFIYIDNVVHRDRLLQILPRDMKSAKRLKLLITARDINACTGCRMENIVYSMKCLSEREAMDLIKKEMNGDEMDDTQMKQIVKACGRVPKLLTLVAGFIRSDENKQKAFSIVMEDAEKLKGQPFENIEHYVFAFDNLPAMCKDPFLDICSFFNGWDWDTVEDIVGQSELDMLKKRALVTKDTNMTLRIHDVILAIGLKKAKGTRYTFSGVSAIQIEDFLKVKDLQGIKGLWFSRTKDPLYISAKKLNSMYNSLRILSLGNLPKVEERCDKAFEKLIFFQGDVPYLPFNVSCWRS